MLIFLAVFFCLASFFYAISLLSTQIVFGFDQARDAFEAFTIWHDHHVKIMGPSSDVPGLNHGVLWYYVLAVAYFLGKGIPENAGFIILLILYLSMPFMAFITYKMSKSSTVTAVTIIFYAMSPLFISFTHWLSNPTLSLLITPPLIYMLWKYLHTQSAKLAILIGVLYGLLIQSDFGFVILLFILPIFFYKFKLKISFKNSFLFFLGVFFATITFFISFLKFHINVFNLVLSFIFRHSSTNFPVSTSALSFIDNMIKFLTLTYMPLPQLLTFFLLVVILYKNKEVFFAKRDTLTDLLLVWMSGILLIFIFNHGSLGAIFFFGPFLFPLAFLVSIFLVRITSRFRILLCIVTVLIILQSMTVYSWTKAGTSPLSVQQGMTTNYERQLVDFTYQGAEGKPFVITTITNPLYINTTWAYLYTMYGKQKYDYVPYLWGKDQTGYLGNLPMQTDLKKVKLRYLISEPPEGIDELWAIKIIYEEDKISTIIEEKRFGTFMVQKRLFSTDKEFVATPAALLEHPTVLNY